MNQNTATDAAKTARTREMNDDLRCQHKGGQVVITNGIDALGQALALRIMMAVAKFDAFGPDNDPYSEHDCATLEVEDNKVLWKIDHFDHSMMYASSDPSDPQCTRRVMTIMLADEY